MCQNKSNVIVCPIQFSKKYIFQVYDNTCSTAFPLREHFLERSLELHRLGILQSYRPHITVNKDHNDTRHNAIIEAVPYKS